MTAADDGDRERAEDERGEGGVLSVHLGRSASCSSIGSFVDFLFVSAVVGSALIGAVAASLRESSAATDPPRREDRPDERQRDDDDAEPPAA
jgi:hypothetical protein